jgi:hypothetical protein
MSMFVTELQLQVLRDARGLPLRSREGKQLYMVLQTFIYASDIAGVIAVPAGFVTDLGSVPRLPIIYLLFGDAFPWAAVVHDFLYSAKSGPTVSRKMADDVLREACEVIGEPAWRRNAVWAAVRAAGGSRFECRG